MSANEPIINKQEDEGRYIPGVCNIGKQEIKRRRNGAIFGTILTTIIIAILLLSHTDKLWRFLVFLPLVSVGIGFQQWYYKFCAGFGMKGVFNFKELGESISVEQAEMLKADKAKAINMIATSVIFGLVLTIVFYLIP
ncbi:MAG TPA: hypothetical protein VK890_10075 [Bacteroidia bacterium]|jgi:hypothetical protein|nr:hypothetical protein [Bacteroidia bacterium]